MMCLGDIFRYKEDLYVYLIESDGIIFSAKILNPEVTNLLVSKRDRDSKLPQKRTDMPMYCFVILTTQDFKGQGAFYGDPAMQSEIVDRMEPIGKRINDEDLILLKNEIKQDRATMSIKLREIFCELF